MGCAAVDWYKAVMRIVYMCPRCSCDSGASYSYRRAAGDGVGAEAQGRVQAGSILGAGEAAGCAVRQHGVLKLLYVADAHCGLCSVSSEC